MKYFDLHCDTAAVLYGRNTDFSDKALHVNSSALAPFEEGRQCFAVCCHDTEGMNINKGMAYYEAVISRLKECLKKEPRLKPILTVEGGGVLEGDIRNLDVLRDMGVKIFGFSWNGVNHLATGNVTDPEAPLTGLGREVLKKLEEYRIYPDISHLSDRGTKDILTLSRLPVIATHSNARGVWDHPRNLTDDQLKEVFESGGIVGLNLCENFLSESPKTEDLLWHLDRMLHCGGEGKVCLGCDWDGCRPVKGVRGVEDTVKLYELFSKGFSVKIADGVVRKNAERFFENDI